MKTFPSWTLSTSPSGRKRSIESISIRAISTAISEKVSYCTLESLSGSGPMVYLEGKFVGYARKGAAS